MTHAMFDTHQVQGFSTCDMWHVTCSYLDVNDADHDSSVSTYSEYTWEISSSSFPHFECVIIDSCDYMLIPQIPANLRNKEYETSVKLPLRKYIVTCKWYISEDIA